MILLLQSLQIQHVDFGEDAEPVEVVGAHRTEDVWTLWGVCVVSRQVCELTLRSSTPSSTSTEAGLRVEIDNDAYVVRGHRLGTTYKGLDEADRILKEAADAYDRLSTRFLEIVRGGGFLTEYLAHSYNDLHNAMVTMQSAHRVFFIARIYHEHGKLYG